VNLVEFILSITLSVMVLGTSVFTGAVFNAQWKSISQEIESSQTARLVMQRMLQEVRQANRINSLSSQNLLSFYNQTNNISYDFWKNKIRRKENLWTSYLTDDGVVRGISFSVLSPKTVRISIKTKVGIISSKAMVRN